MYRQPDAPTEPEELRASYKGSFEYEARTYVDRPPLLLPNLRRRDGLRKGIWHCLVWLTYCIQVMTPLAAGYVVIRYYSVWGLLARMGSILIGVVAVVVAEALGYAIRQDLQGLGSLSDWGKPSRAPTKSQLKVAVREYSRYLRERAELQRQNEAAWRKYGADEHAWRQECQQVRQQAAAHFATLARQNAVRVLGPSGRDVSERECTLLWLLEVPRPSKGNGEPGLQLPLHEAASVFFTGKGTEWQEVFEGWALSTDDGTSRPEYLTWSKHEYSQSTSYTVRRVGPTEFVQFEGAYNIRYD
jgi:hypothetical protein